MPLFPLIILEYWIKLIVIATYIYIYYYLSLKLSQKNFLIKCVFKLHILKSCVILNMQTDNYY